MENTDYILLCRQLRTFIEEEPWYLPVLANASALLYHTLPDLNWAGFYLVRDGALILGPFQGRTACIRIARGRGVCGTAWEKDEIQVVPDVHAFPGHIACDSASRSEIVLPIHSADGTVLGVLDIDSPSPSRFTAADAEGLAAFVRIIEGTIGDRPLWSR